MNHLKFVVAGGAHRGDVRALQAAHLREEHQLAIGCVCLSVYLSVYLSLSLCIHPSIYVSPCRLLERRRAQVVDVVPVEDEPDGQHAALESRRGAAPVVHCVDRKIDR